LEADLLALKIIKESGLVPNFNHETYRQVCKILEKGNQISQDNKN